MHRDATTGPLGDVLCLGQTGGRPVAHAAGPAWFIEKLGTDTLPGITEAKVTALGTLLGAMNTALENQETAQSGATSTRGTVEDQLKSITARRMTIQFAADAHWPWHDKHNAAVRKEFQLPKETVFAG